MNKADFLERCATIYDMGLADEKILRLLDKWTDFVLRFEGGQMKYVADFIEDEDTRLKGFAPQYTLANDDVGYKVIQMVAVLIHPCQICATDKDAWHTRPGFCRHKAQPNTAPGGE